MFVCLSVCLSVHQSVSLEAYTQLTVGTLVTQFENRPKGDLTYVTAPAHPYATDAVVYTTLS